MTEPALPPDANPTPSPPPRKRYGRERAFVAVVFFALTGAVIVNGAAQIWRDTYRSARVPAPYATCSEGIHRLYRDFRVKLETADYERGAMPRRPSADPASRADVAMYDELLIALRPLCEREGADAHSAYDALTLWRHQYEDLSRVQEHTLVPDAERALRYVSPGARNPSGSEP